MVHYSRAEGTMVHYSRAEGVELNNAEHKAMIKWMQRDELHDQHYLGIIALPERAQRLCEALAERQQRCPISDLQAGEGLSRLTTGTWTNELRMPPPDRSTSFPPRVNHLGDLAMAPFIAPPASSARIA